MYLYSIRPQQRRGHDSHAVAMDFAMKLKDENPRFDISRFVGACNSHATVGSVEVKF